MLSGINSTTMMTPKVARQLKAQIEELFHRYSFEDVIAEVARQKPKYNIAVSEAKGK